MCTWDPAKDESRIKYKALLLHYHRPDIGDHEQRKTALEQSLFSSWFCVFVCVHAYVHALCVCVNSSLGCPWERINDRLGEGFSKDLTAAQFTWKTQITSDSWKEFIFILDQKQDYFTPKLLGTEKSQLSPNSSNFTVTSAVLYFPLVV